ncbi:MAG: class I SAM-dependent methyltransferase [Deltaproteobacteria bacterium]|nr:class I SAM-dependent methyltransferase [Deltaproteobacteria bacterium]
MAARTETGRPSSESFLVAFHRAHPGCTSEAFARGRIDGGGSSYHLLADVVPAAPGGARVLDLGCGDGHLLELLTARGLPPSALAGIDLSGEELDRGRARRALSASALVQCRAQELPFAAGSFHAVLSHLAFMLMDDIEEVVEEVVRVLAPEGTFATVVGGGPKVGDSFELFLDLLAPIRRRVGSPTPRLGDRRCLREEGLHELLGRAAGFEGPPRIDDFAVDLRGTADAVWRTLSTIYEMHELPADARAELHGRFVPAALALSDDGVTVPCSMFVRRVVATRR